MGKAARAKKNQHQSMDLALVDVSFKSPSKNSHLAIQSFEPLTENQQTVFDQWQQGQNLLLHGLAGTGKTFISAYLALRDVLNPKTDYRKLVLIRSAVATRDIGFLPGSIEEKLAPYEQAFKSIVNEIAGRGDAYEILKKKDVIQFISTSHVRGKTFRNSVIIVDEINNMSFHELDSVITRTGPNCRIALCGDYNQSDLKGQHDRDGLLEFMRILHDMNSFTTVEFDIPDIVRSGLVKEYLTVKALREKAEAIHSK
jgi:phosphate starvation-inducible protein PhoH